MRALEHILAVVRQAGALKDTERSAYTFKGRRESTAEHSWRLGFFAMLLQPLYPTLNMEMVLKLCLIHDLGEALHGDIPAVEQDAAVSKSLGERRDLLSVLQELPEEEQEGLVRLWDDYDQARTPEARLVKALDKLETLLQHTEGCNPPDFDYAFNLEYGRPYTELDEVTRALRTLIDAQTRLKMPQEQPFRDNVPPEEKASG